MKNKRNFSPQIISENQVSYFLYEISKKFPDSFLAGVICDKHGFLLAGARKGRKFQNNMQENDLALLAIAYKQEFKKDSGFLKIQRNLNESEDIKLLLLRHQPRPRDGEEGLVKGDKSLNGVQLGLLFMMHNRSHLLFLLMLNLYFFSF